MRPLFLLLLALSACTPHDDFDFDTCGVRPRYVLPLAFRAGQPIVQGSIGGKPAEFILDTGATTILLTEAAAERLGVPVNQRQVVTSQGMGGAVRSFAATLRDLKIGQIEVPDHQIRMIREFPDSSGLAPTLRAAVARMARVASLCRHGDGDVPLFNDSAIGQTRTPADVLDYVARVTNPREDMTRPDFVALPDFGLFRLGDARACLWLDAGETGPPFLQAHAHADTGGFELSVGATRYVVDGGVSSYQDRGRRARDRSTRAHSTVVVEGEDSSDCWGSFRVARRARIVDRAWNDAERGQSVSFSHDGFHHLAGAPTHARTVSYRGGIYSIRDRVERQGPGGLRCDALLNLGPGVVVTPGGSGWTAIHRDQPGVSLRISIEVIADDREIRLEPWVSSTGFHDERSGLRLRAACWSAGARVDIRTEISVSTG